MFGKKIEQKTTERSCLCRRSWGFPSKKFLGKIG